MKKYDVIIIGAGASGMMAALFAPKDKQVLLLEKNDFVGRKILATGNGRCNLTNKNISPDRFHGAAPDFISNVLNRFDQFETMNLFESLGVVLKDEDRGRIFPRTNQATTVVDALKHAIEKDNITIKTSSEVKKVDKVENLFIVKTEKETYSAVQLVLTTGGKAAFQFGSSGDGLFWAKNMGHTIKPIYAALCPVESTDNWVKELQGVKIEAKVQSHLNTKILKETYGDVLFTHYGLSGPAIMAHAREIAPKIENQPYFSLDLVPELNEKDLDQKLATLIENNSKKGVKNIVAGLIPSNLAPIILNLSQVNDKKAAEISKAERQKITETLKSLKVSISKIRPLKEAQVSRGGINSDEIKVENLESKIVSGLYFAGEIIDVDGDSGGFNLQWAWSSGYVVGTSL